MSLLAPLRHGPFRLLLAGRTISSLGNAIAPIALAFAVLDLTGSASDLGLVVGTRTLVNVLFLLFGGAARRPPAEEPADGRRRRRGRGHPGRGRRAGASPTPRPSRC